jgi:hypothetical protein
MVNAVVRILVNGLQNRDFKMRFDTDIDYMFHEMLYTNNSIRLIFLYAPAFEKVFRPNNLSEEGVDVSQRPFLRFRARSFG